MAEKIYPFPWNGNSLVEKMYEEQNYKVITTCSQSGNAILFFSGNGLYFPDETETFYDTICKKDRYEWENVAKSPLIQRCFSKIIFIRDIYKQWYVKGINHKVNSVTKLIELMRHLTQGEHIVTCGNSAGGYMAVLVGKEIGAERIFSFSGQFSCWNRINEEPMLQLYKRDSDYNKWYGTEHLLKKSGGVFYFYPAYCKQDEEQIVLAKDAVEEGIYPFAFDGDVHGVTVAAECYKYILTMDNGRLIDLSEKYKSQVIQKDDFFFDVLHMAQGASGKLGFAEAVLAIGRLIKREGRKQNLVVCPYGEKGRLVKSVLNEIFGIREMAVVDNHLCATEEGIISIAELAKAKEKYTVLLSTEKSDIKEYLMDEISKSELADVFDVSALGRCE
ncbi:hypothetical protein [Acetatifactor aquisgranensis]|uniref:hypothetical protein n=1 Tax=Acetatifactor aquisgranensis TaxID=2941233 RepID=UPI0020412D62|nr:hypothetical protein [Acetatifactor aquisgranensis]